MNPYYLPLICTLLSEAEQQWISKTAGSCFKIHGAPLFCAIALSKRLAQSALWSHEVRLLSTSVLPFPSSPLSLSLSLVITVKVQLRCLRWELSQRCVTTMWCFTRLVTKPPAVVHTCGINKYFHHHHHHHHHHHLLPVGTLVLPQVQFPLTGHRRYQFKFSFFLFFRNSFDRLKGNQTQFFS